MQRGACFGGPSRHPVSGLVCLNPVCVDPVCLDAVCLDPDCLGAVREALDSKVRRGARWTKKVTSRQGFRVRGSSGCQAFWEVWGTHLEGLGEVLREVLGMISGYAVNMLLMF